MSDIITRIEQIRSLLDEVENETGSADNSIATYQRFKPFYPGAREKLPKAITSLDGVYSLKRLSEGI